MEYLSEFLVSFVGALAGAAVAGIAFLMKKSEETKQKYRLVIFELLAIHQSLKATQEFTPAKYYEAFSRVAADLGHPEFQAHPELKQFMEPLIAPQIAAQLKQIKNWSGGGYASAVQTIAPINPVLANVLRANLLLESALSKSQEYFQRYLNAIKDHGVDPKSIETTLPTIESELFNDVIKELENDINSMAMLVGYREQRKTKRLFKSRSEPMDASLKPLVGQMFAALENAGHIGPDSTAVIRR